MRRRSRRPPNDSESTGKIGQELPSNQLAPLRPSYPEEMPQRESGEGARPEASLQSGGEDHPAPAPDRRIEVETQPENLGIAQPEAAAAKSPKGYVVLAIGLPGSGKTTWYKRRGVSPLSSDMLRTILFDDITEQRYQGLVFSTLRSLLRARLIARMPWNYVDATNLSPHERRQWIKMAKSFGYEVHAVFFDVPLAVCMERNSMRDRAVTDEVMQKMAERLRPPSFKEGFEKITVVRVKGQPGTEPASSSVAGETARADSSGSATSVSGQAEDASAVGESEPAAGVPAAGRPEQMVSALTGGEAESLSGEPTPAPEAGQGEGVTAESQATS